MNQPATNILLIQADQWPWFALGARGCPNVRTPNLDRLAREGTLFTHTTCQSPICLPSRVSMLSGQYPTRTQQFGFVGLNRREMPWLPETLRQAGYATAAFGKFHVMSVGIDRWNFEVSMPTLPEDEPLARPPGSSYRDYCRRHGVRFPTDQMHGHSPFHGDDGPEPAKQPGLSAVPAEHGLDKWTTDRALEYLETRAGNPTPFFVWLTYDRPHYPTALPPEWLARCRPDALKLPPLPSAEALPSWPRSAFQLLAEGPSIAHVGAKEFRFVLSTYYTLIELLDAEIGRVLEFLDRTGLAKTTTVIFTADHGDDAGFGGLFDKARLASSDAILRVPLIIRPAPALQPAPPRLRPEPVELLDLFPTICALTGVAAPPTIEGRDLSGALLRDAALALERPVFCEEYHQRAVRRGDWLLVFDREDNRECHFYNLARDPNQFANRYDDATCRAERVALKRDLLRFICGRLFGDYTAFDVERMRRGLDPNDPLLPVHTSHGVRPQVYAFRSAAFVVDATHKLFVPFYEEDEPLLFALGEHPLRDAYSTRDRAVAADPAIVERLLDTGVRYLLNHTPTVSLLLPRPVAGPKVSAAEAAALVAKMTADK